MYIVCLGEHVYSVIIIYSVFGHVCIELTINLFECILVFYPGDHMKKHSAVKLARPYVRRVETPSHEPALEVFEGEQFQLVIAASIRAREIQNRRLKEEEAEPGRVWANSPVVAALVEIGELGRE